MTYFLVAVGGVLVGWLARDVTVKAQRHRRILVEPYPQRISEPTSNVVWLDDDSGGLTVD